MAAALLVLTALVPFPWLVFPNLPPLPDWPRASAATEQDATPEQARPEQASQAAPVRVTVPDGGVVLLSSIRVPSQPRPSHRQDATPEPVVQQAPPNVVAPDGGKVLIRRHRGSNQSPVDASGTGAASPSEAPALCPSCEAAMQEEVPTPDAEQDRTRPDPIEIRPISLRDAWRRASPEPATDVMMMVTPKIEITEEEERMQVGDLGARRPGPIESLESDSLLGPLLQAGAAIQFRKRDAQRGTESPSAAPSAGTRPTQVEIVFTCSSHALRFARQLKVDPRITVLRFDCQLTDEQLSDLRSHFATKTIERVR